MREITPNQASYAWPEWIRPAARQKLEATPGLDEEGYALLERFVGVERKPSFGAAPWATRESPSGKYSVVFKRPERLVLEIRNRDEKVVATLSCTPWRPTVYYFNKDETRLLVAYHHEGQRQLVLWDVAKGERLRTAALNPAEDNTRNGEVRFLSLSPDERHAAVATEGNACWLVDLETECSFPEQPLRGSRPGVFSPDSRRAVCFGSEAGDEDWTLWDLAARKQLASIKRPWRNRWPVFSPSGAIMLLANRLLRTETGEVLHEFGKLSAALLYRFSADGTRLLAQPSNDTLPALWNFETGKRLAALEENGGDRLRNMLFTPDGRHVVAVYRAQLAIHDAETGKLLGSHAEEGFPFEYHRNIQEPFFLKDGRMVTVHHAGALVWNIETQQPLHRFPTKPVDRPSAVLTEDERELLVVTPGAMAILWDLGTGAVVQSFDTYPYGVDQIRFSEDGTRLFARHRTGQSVRSWNIASGRVVAEYYIFNGGGDWLTIFPQQRKCLGATEFVRKLP